MIDEVRLKFMALRDEEAPPRDELKVMPLGEVPEAFLGLDDTQRPHLLLATDEDQTALRSDIAALEVGSRVLTIAGAPRAFLDIGCLVASVAEVFDHFIVAVIDRLEAGAERPVTAVGKVLDQWRHFLVAASGPPGRDKLATVFGELLVVLDVVRVSGTGIRAWVGPFGSRHDLRDASTAVEVKTTRSHSARIVTVHGEDQLLEPDNGTLYLHLVRLEAVPDGGRSVSSLVDEILAAGAPAQELFHALATAGIPPVDLPAVDGVRFDVRERTTFPVDERLPRIVPGSFVHGTRPVGVIDLSYRVELDHALEWALDDVSYGDVVRRLAGGG
jgi:Putative  PD-(D/E)XK family member, (DUF4420)